MDLIGYGTVKKKKLPWRLALTHSHCPRADQTCRSKTVTLRAIMSGVSQTLRSPPERNH